MAELTDSASRSRHNLPLDTAPPWAYTVPMKQTKVSLPEDLRAWLRAEKTRTGESESSIIRTALRKEQLAGGKENGNGQ